MGCKLSVSVVHPELLLKRLSPSTKKQKTKTLNPVVNPTTKTTSNDSYETLYIDSPQQCI